MFTSLTAGRLVQIHIMDTVVDVIVGVDTAVEMDLEGVELEGETADIVTVWDTGSHLAASGKYGK